VASIRPWSASLDELVVTRGVVATPMMPNPLLGQAGGSCRGLRCAVVWPGTACEEITARRRPGSRREGSQFQIECGLIKAFFAGFGLFESARPVSSKWGLPKSASCVRSFRRQQNIQIDVGDVIEILVARVPELQRVFR